MTDKRPHLFITEQLPPPKDREFKNSGGGGTYLRTSYQQHANKIYEEAALLKQEFAQIVEVNKISKRYFRVELPKDQTAWSSAGKKLEKDILANIVGSPQKNIAHVSTNASSFDLLVEQLSNYQSSESHSGKSKFAALENISSIPLSEKITDRLKRRWESEGFVGEVLISLFPDLTNEERETYKTAIEAFLQQHTGTLINTYNSETGLILKVKAKKVDLESLGNKFLAVQCLDSVDEIIIPSSQPGEFISQNVIVVASISEAKACIFDSGVASGSRLIGGALIGQENPLGNQSDPAHGTFVASRIIYGDSLRDQISAGKLTPDVKVLSVCIFPRDDLGNPLPASTEQIMRVVRDTVERWHQKIKVYNLSLNLFSKDPLIGSSITDDTINPLSAELDFLSRKYNVLFVVTAGNFPAPGAVRPSEQYPAYFESEEARICPPAEAMLAITVGSVAGRDNEGSMVKKDAPSPFTRRGPGFSQYKKPDLIAHGGNNGLNWQPFDDLSVAGIRHDEERVAYGIGTSYAAPVITRLAAHLFSVIPNASSELIRAMLIHFAKYKNVHDIEEELLLKLVGNGSPDVNALMSSNPWEQTYLYQGTIDYRKIARVPFYIPKGLVGRNGNNVLRVKVTIASSPETDRTLKSGYCKSYLRTKLCKRNTHDELVSVAPGNSIDVITDPYATVVRRDNQFSKGLLHGDWELVIEQVSRWTLKDPNTRYGVAITISDPRRDAGIDIAAMLQNEVPSRYSTQVNIREHIRL